MAKHKIAVISICSILLLAMVVAVTMNNKTSDDSLEAKNNVGISTSTKAIKDICRPTDYRQTCENSLSSEAGNSSDPKELIKVAFKVTEKEIRKALKKSTTIQKAAKDPSTADAFKICQEVLGDAIDDLYRSLQRFNASDVSKWDDYAYDLKIWLSGTVAYQETCLDGFQNTTGDTGQKMTQLLKTSRELTVNALVIIEEFSKAYASLTGSNRRRLLSAAVRPHELSDESPLCQLFRIFCNPESNPEDPFLSTRRFLLDETLSEDPTDVPKRKKTKHQNPFYAMYDFFTDKKSSKESSMHAMPADENIFRRRKLLSAEAPSEYVNNDTAPGPVQASPAPGPVQASPDNMTSNVIVAQDGSGKYTTIEAALKDIPLGNNKPFVINIKAGVYREYVQISKEMTNVVLIGDGPTNTIITGNKSVIHDGLKTYHTPTLGVDGFGFVARDIGIENTAGQSGEQAVALRVSSDQSAFYNCHIDGYQDTLYAHVHRQFYRDCTISGTIDFIFGDAAAVFQNCNIVIRKPGENQACMVTAQGRKFEYEPTGFVLQNCNITGDADYLASQTPIKSFLGRPWKDYAKTMVLNSKIDSVIQPQGWEPWPPNMYIDTCWYSEYGNIGPAASLTDRVKWPGIKQVTTMEEAENFTPGKFLKGDEWIPATGVPYYSGMITAAA